MRISMAKYSIVVLFRTTSMFMRNDRRYQGRTSAASGEQVKSYLRTRFRVAYARKTFYVELNYAGEIRLA